jgi:hypothetical protein
VDAVSQLERVGDGRHPGAADIVARDRNGRRSGADMLGLAAGQRHVDLHELLDREALEIAGHHLCIHCIGRCKDQAGHG